MKKRAQDVAVGYDLNRVDRVALILIWLLVILIITQTFLENAGEQVVTTIQALLVGSLITGLSFLKMNRFLKSLLMGLIPALAVYAAFLTSVFSIDRHYMLCLLTVVVALYFDRKLLFVYGVIMNVLLIAVYVARPENLLGSNHGIAYFLSVFFMYTGELIALYFLTKWGREIISNVEKSKAELQGVFDELQVSSLAREKRAEYMEQGVQSLLDSMDRLSQGELGLRLSLREPDEATLSEYTQLERIGAKLSESVASIRGYIDEIAAVLAEVSAGNLRATVETEFKGDFMELKTSINSIVTSLNTVLCDINTTAEQVTMGTRQVCDGSQCISQGAIEQASSIEELTASVSSIAAQTRDNAANADTANVLSASAMESAKRGSERMETLQTAMNAIDAASSDIAKIIKVIDEIAFQTNILALNAAVEAARAGVHGKGFAVVAEEVRNLAAKSAEAAHETEMLIKGSVKKTEAGARLANETARELNGIVEAVERAAGLVSDIAAASNDQATAILQVDKGIEQLSSVVQQNSATAQEAAATSEQLSAQAQLLKTKVERFALA